MFEHCQTLISSSLSWNKNDLNTYLACRHIYREQSRGSLRGRQSSGLSRQIKCEEAGSSLGCTATNYTQQKLPSVSFSDKGQWSESGSRVKCEEAKKLPSLLAWHCLCRSLSGRPVTLLWLFCWPYNGFLCTYATRRLAEIIFFSCLARLQLRNKLLMEARGRLLIIEASHPVDLFPTLFFLLRNSSIAVTGERETICSAEDTRPAPSKPRPWHWMARSWLLATNTVISTGPKRDCPGLLIIYVRLFPHLLASRCLQLGFQTIRSRTCRWQGLFATRRQNIRRSSISSALCTTHKYNFIGGVTKILQSPEESCTQSQRPT